MANFIDLSILYGDEELSDITIAFGEHRFKGHKLILSLASDYFKSMLGPHSRFAEKTQDTIELKDDDPEALGALLKFIYTKIYDAKDITQSEWLFHLHVAQAANKYLMKGLEKKAFSCFEYEIMCLADLDEISKVIEIVPTIEYCNKDLHGIVRDLRKQHFEALIQQPRFQEALSADTEQMLEDVKRLAFASNLRKRFFSTCSECKSKQLSMDEWAFCMTCKKEGLFKRKGIVCWI